MSNIVSNKKTARIAGLVYLGIVLTGTFSLMYIPSKLFVSGNASITFQKIVSSEPLFRLGILSGLFCYGLFLFLPLVLYKLFKPVNENYAKLMVLLAVVSVPMYFINAQNEFSVLSLIGTSGHFYGLTTEQIQTQVLLYLEQYDNGMRVIHIFSGLWLFPFGYLVFKSGFLPKFLGILLILGCFGYLINFIGNTLFLNYQKLGIAAYIQLPASLGEIGTCLWLVVMRVKEIKTFTEPK